MILFDPGYRAQLHAHAAAVDSESRRVAAIEGDVWCSVKTVCWRAGKPFAVDDFKVEQMLYTCKLTQTELDDLLAKRHITYVALDARADVASLARNLLTKYEPAATAVVRSCPR